MKQKGKRFYVEKKPEKVKEKKIVADAPLVDEAVASNEPDIAETKAFDIKVKKSKANLKAEKEEKSRERARIKASKKIEKKRQKAIKENNKTSEKNGELTVKSDNSKILKFESKDKKSSRFSQFAEAFNKNKKPIVMCGVIILILALSVLIFANRDRLSFSSIKNWLEYGVFNMESEEHFPVSTQDDIITNGNFSRTDRNLVFSSDTKFCVLNNYGKTIFENSQAFSSPVLSKASDSDLTLVYNLGGTGFTIYNLDSIVYEGEAEENIMVADISKSGTYALVTEKDGYLSKLFVYSNENKQIFAYSFADYYITSVSLDSKGDSAVLSGISAHDGTQYSAVYLLEFTKEEPVIFEEFKDNILYYVEHLTNNYVCVIGDSATYTMNAMTKTFNITSYDGKSLTAFDVDTDTNTYALSLSRSGDGRKCDILVFSTSGSLREAISTELMITDISTYKNRVGVLSSGNVYLYSKDGSLISENNAGLDPHCLVLYSTTDAYILGVSEIRRLDL